MALAVAAAVLMVVFLPIAGRMRPLLVALTGGSAIVFALGARLPRLSLGGRTVMLVLPPLAVSVTLYLTHGLSPVAAAAGFTAAVFATLARGPWLGAAVGTAFLAALGVALAMGPPFPMPVVQGTDLAFLRMAGVLPLLALCVYGAALAVRRLEGAFHDSLHLVDRLETEATERARAEREGRRLAGTLSQAEENFQLAFFQSPVALTITAMDGTWIALNEAFTRAFGWNIEEDVGRKTVELGFWVDPLEREDLLRRFVAAGQVTEMPVRVRTKAGDERVVQLSSRQFGNGHILSALRDVTEERRLAAQMDETQERFRLAFHTSADAFSISRVGTGLFLAVNAGFSHMFGWNEGEVVGKTSFEIGFWQDPDERGRMAEILKERGRFQDFEAHMVRKDRAVRTVLVSGSLFRGSDGTAQVLTVLRDVTDARRLAAERKRLQEQFSQAQKMEAVGRLAGGVAHEFNNLLTSMGASAGYIAMEAPAGSEFRSIAAEMEAAVERGTQLTRQLLAFTQRQVLQPRPVDVNALLGDMRRVLERLLGEDVRVVLDPSREPCRVLADPGQLQQVVLNLVVNAKDAMPKGGRILISVSRRPGTSASGDVVIEVADEGPGIAPQVMEHLFEPFYSTKQDGTGLGLASVYGIVKQHQGTVEVDAGFGKGATFRVRLPAATAVDPAAVGTPGMPARGAGQRVLLVDDEAAVRRSTERLLVRLGYHVTVASSGDEALAIVDGGAPVDVVVTDVAMPGMNGSDLVQRILAKRPGTPALFVSGYAQEFLSPEILESGRLAFLPKPFSSEGLAEKLRELLVAA